MIKLYPEGSAEARFKINGVKKILFYCNREGLFFIDVMKGIDNNLFEPERNVNRAEIATILNRLTKFLDIKNNT